MFIVLLRRQKAYRSTYPNKQLRKCRANHRRRIDLQGAQLVLVTGLVLIAKGEQYRFLHRIAHGAPWKNHRRFIAADELADRISGDDAVEFWAATEVDDIDVSEVGVEVRKASAAGLKYNGLYQSEHQTIVLSGT